MWQSGLQGAIGKGTHQSPYQHNEHGSMSRPDQDIYGTGTGPCQRPAQTKEDPAQHVPCKGYFMGGQYDLFPEQGFCPGALYPLYQKYAQGDGRTDDPVHMEGIKLEHFVNAEPRGGLRFIEDHPKEASQNHIEDILHSGKIKGNNRWTMISSPMKKPKTAKREGSCRLLRPEMAWPEVQPPA